MAIRIRYINLIQSNNGCFVSFLMSEQKGLPWDEWKRRCEPWVSDAIDCFMKQLEDGVNAEDGDGHEEESDSAIFCPGLDVRRRLVSTNLGHMDAQESMTEADDVADDALSHQEKKD